MFKPPLRQTRSTATLVVSHFLKTIKNQLHHTGAKFYTFVIPDLVQATRVVSDPKNHRMYVKPNKLNSSSAINCSKLRNAPRTGYNSGFITSLQDYTPSLLLARHGAFYERTAHALIYACIMRNNGTSSTRQPAVIVQ